VTQQYAICFEAGVFYANELAAAQFVPVFVTAKFLMVTAPCILPLNWSL
jgi:hypothetical protein